MTDSARRQSSLNERLNFIGMDQKARTALSKLQPLLRQSLGPALATFYEKVKATPETRKFFGDDRHMAGAKGRQEEHWQIIASATYDDAYVDAVLKIGQTHARIGLEPRWYIGGYALVIEQLIHAIVKEQWPSLLQMNRSRSESVAESLSCLVKAAMLDMDLAISVYLETLDEQRRKAEEAGQEGIRQERTIVANSIGVGLAKLADKDLTYRIEAEMPEAYHQLQGDFNAAIEQLEAAMQSVSSRTNAIQSGTQEMATAAKNLSHRTEQQAASLEETAAALDQITATVKTSAEGAAHAREVVIAADQDAKQSALIVRQAVEAMDEIMKSARQINQIIGVIDEIAFQTNLLALNAGVEAARAGDAGRGFAVVASEVRALAQRSAEAAREIKELISASTTRVEGGVKLVMETGKSLERILEQVTDINNVVTQIAVGAQEQATGLEQVNSAINHMDQATQQNAAMVEESTAATHSLSQETEQLSELIGQFQVGRANDSDYIRRELRRVAPHAFRSAATRAIQS
ncbi:globin-coupled sensor protein [Pseudaminobacter soli (ex Li et al. 2025)]|uniref:Globin-coupled sensor protein n=1 Tax=Pseudaminobacter soli (ex Li et al. 2025) TaxID=1295366 RepID=A0A2P7SHG2_9HYPH|nr:globin-coupled sensor protein [Mesorhizobium soli]PSJ61936.1 globin-coupled sensor protein [Mesorhizobium soli]